MYAIRVCTTIIIIRYCHYDKRQVYFFYYITIVLFDFKKYKYFIWVSFSIRSLHSHFNDNQFGHFFFKRLYMSKWKMLLIIQFSLVILYHSKTYMSVDFIYLILINLLIFGFCSQISQFRTVICFCLIENIYHQ